MIGMDSLEQIRHYRLEKLKELTKNGIDPYPEKSQRDFGISYLNENFNSLMNDTTKITIAGRLMSKREFGGLTFGHLKDFSGEVQVLFKKDHIGEAAYDDLALIDIGDIIQVSGTAMITQKGEPTVLVDASVMLAKALRPLPEKWHGLTDVESRYRQRYLDLLMNQEVKQRFLIKHKLLQSIRQFLVDRGFIEVETPVFQTLAGGALATPFKTYYEAIDAEVFLRIAPELYLKRLIVGGFEKVFEMGRVFRNEGVSIQHLQEFTEIEFYQAYATYEDLMTLTEEMFAHVLMESLGTYEVKYKDHILNFKTPWPRKSFQELIFEHTKIDIDDFDTADKLAEAIKEKGIKLTFSGKAGRGKLIDELYKEKVRPLLINPLFLIDHPLDLSPLAKKKVDDPTKVQRFQLVVAGFEIVNAFSELNDPIDQKERFDSQARLKHEGDIEAHSADDDFVKALEYGMPPTAGWGMGIDRLLAIITDADTIREAVLFPFVKDKE